MMDALEQELRLDISDALAKIENVETALLHLQGMAAHLQELAAEVNTAIQAIGVKD